MQTQEDTLCVVLGPPNFGCSLNSSFSYCLRLILTLKLALIHLMSCRTTTLSQFTPSSVPECTYKIYHKVSLFLLTSLPLCRKGMVRLSWCKISPNFGRLPMEEKLKSKLSIVAFKAIQSMATVFSLSILNPLSPKYMFMFIGFL